MYQVLLVDDEPLILAGIKFMIDWQKNDCQIAGTAGNGQQALEALRTLQPDIVICDIAMPVLSGIELLQRAAEETPETVFIMLTNHQDFQLARNSLRYRSVDYLLKSDLDEATLEASLARAKAERDSRRRLAQASAVENYLESNRQSLLENAFLSVILTPPGASCASAAEVLQGNGVLNGYAAAYIPIRFDGIAGYAGFADNERARLFNWQRELCEKLAGNLFPAFVLLTPDAPAQSEALFLLCWDLPQDGWEGRLRTYADKLTAASATITQARPCVLGTRRFASGGELDECRAEVFALRDHYYLTGSETKMFYSELPAVEWGRLSLAGIADRLDAEVRSKNASACAVLLDRAIDRVRTVPHQKSQALWLCGEIRSALAARLGEEFGRSWPPIERLATREQVLQWLQTAKNELGEQLAQSGHSRSPLVEKACRYVQDNVDKHIMLQDVADYVCISPGYLSALFKKEYNQNFVDYINEVKTRRAQELIREGRYRIYEISYMLGFENAYYFTRVFKRYTGMTPSEYQKQQRSGRE